MPSWLAGVGKHGAVRKKIAGVTYYKITDGIRPGKLKARAARIRKGGHKAFVESRGMGIFVLWSSKKPKKEKLI